MNETGATSDKGDARPHLEPITVPVTLQGFYAEKRVKAPAFVRAIEKNAVRLFTPDDEQAAMALLDTADPFRERTLGLLSAASTVRRRSISDLLFGWTQSVLRHDAAALAATGAFEEGSGQFNAETLVEALSHAARPTVQGKDKTARRHAEARLRLARAWAATRAGTNPIRLARHAVVAVQGRPDIRGAQGLRDRALRFVANADLKTLDQALALLSLTDAAVVDAQASEARANQEAANLRKALQRLEADLGAARTEASGLSAALEAEGGKVARLERQLQDQRLGAQADLRATSGRISRFLGGRLLALLEQAREAAEMEPPRADIAREFLAGLEAEITGEIEWLNARSG